jgi:transcriptional regulator with XRE-family HTH domain
MEAMNLTDTVGGRFEVIRKNLHMSQRELAGKLQISHTTISDIEHNRTRPHFDVICKLIAEYNVNHNFLFFGKGEPFLAAPGDSEAGINFPGPLDEKISRFLTDLKQSAFVLYSTMGFYQKLERDNHEHIKAEREDWIKENKGK